jgi:hypothetical protein
MEIQLYNKSSRILDFVYSNFYIQRIKKTTYWEVLEFIENCRFYIDTTRTLEEYKKYTFFKFCNQLGIDKSEDISKDLIVSFFENKNQDSPVNFCDDVVRRI